MLGSRVSPIVLAVGLAAALLTYALEGATVYGLRVLTVAGVYALAVIGYQLIFGLAGALSLAQGTFFGLGSYVTGILAARYGLPFEATFPLSLLAPTILAVIVAAPVLRLASHYFALATLGIGQVVLVSAVHWQSLTGGANGIAGVPGVVLFGLDVSRGLGLCLLVWGWVGVAAAVALWAKSGRRGLGYAMLRADPLVGQCLGLAIGRWRLAAFLLSAALAGAAGALAVHAQRVVSPAGLEFSVMVTILTMTVVGGRGRVLGAVVGALFIIHLPEWLRGFEQAYLLVYGLLLLGTIVLLPEGLAGLWERLRIPHRSDAVSSAQIADPAIWKPTAAAEPHQGHRGPPPLLSVEGLQKSYGGVRALAEVSFTIAPGELVGLIGPNGSGKTTLLNLLSGVDRADGGTVCFDGRSVRTARLTPQDLACRGVARTFQAGALPAGLTALDAVAAARVATEDRRLSVMRRHAYSALALVGAADAAATACEALPPGVQRRVELARALARDPKLLLLDEPAAGLTAIDRGQLAQVLARVAQYGITVLVVEHDVPFLSGLATRILCLAAGRLIYDGPAAAVGEDAAVRAAYFGGRAPE